MIGDLRVDYFGAERPESAKGPFLVGFDEPRVARDISGEDRREPAFDASWPAGLHDASLVADDPTPTSGMRALSKKGRALAPSVRRLRPLRFLR